MTAASTAERGDRHCVGSQADGNPSVYFPLPRLPPRRFPQSSHPRGLSGGLFPSSLLGEFLFSENSAMCFLAGTENINFTLAFKGWQLLLMLRLKCS